jgi:hypothetical protein
MYKIKSYGLILLGIFLLFVGIVVISDTVSIPEDSPTTKAILDNEYSEITTSGKTTGKTKTYLIKYSYQVNGKTYRKSEKLSYEPKPEMTVHYLKDKPEIAKIDISVNYTYVLYILVGLALVGYGIYRIRKPTKV